MGRYGITQNATGEISRDYTSEPVTGHTRGSTISSKGSNVPLILGLYESDMIRVAF